MMSAMTRRSFMQSVGAALATAGLNAAGRARAAGANDRLNIGIIGCGHIAGAHLSALLTMRNAQNIAVTGVCDVHRSGAEALRERIAQAGGEAVLYPDYRALLDDRDIGYVVICTPEHAHAFITLDALDAGKDVYCEKPLTMTVREALKVRDVAHRSGRKLQVGVQGMSDDSYASAHEAIKAGKIGTVIQAQIDYVRNYTAEAGLFRGDVDPHMAKPDDLDWDAWLGPAPRRPWDPRRYHDWRCYREYSGGIGGDLFVHRVTRIIRACGLTYPTHAVGMGGIYLWDDGRTLPDNFEMLVEYPAAAGVTNGMTVHVLGTQANNHGIEHCIRGTTGTLVFTRSGWEIRSLGSRDIAERHEKTGGEQIGLHHMNLQAAIREGAALNCPVDLGVYGTVAVRMANMSWFQRKLLRWRTQRESVVHA